MEDGENFRRFERKKADVKTLILACPIPVTKREKQLYINAMARCCGLTLNELYILLKDTAVIGNISDVDPALLKKFTELYQYKLMNDRPLNWRLSNSTKPVIATSSLFCCYRWSLW